MAFEFTFGDLIDEAAERAGLDTGALTHRHLTSIKRSLNLLLIDIENEGARPEYRIDTVKLPIVVGQQGVRLPPDTIDVLDVVLRYPNGGMARDYSLSRSHREDWMRTADKASTGHPTSYWVSKSTPGEYGILNQLSPGDWGDPAWGGGTWGGPASASQPADGDENILVLWPASAIDGEIIFSRLRTTAAPDTLLENLDARRNWYETLAAGLAAKIAEKFNKGAEDGLLIKYRDKLKNRLQSEDRGPVVVGFRAYGFSRGRRH